MVLYDRIALALMIPQPPNNGLERRDIAATVADWPECRPPFAALGDEVSAVFQQFVNKTQVHPQQIDRSYRSR